jgi:hypothetical protein
MLADSEYVRQMEEIEKLFAAHTITAEERRASLQAIGQRRVLAAGQRVGNQARRGEAILPGRVRW